MESLYQNITFSDNLPINIAIGTVPGSSRQWLNCIELFLVLSGELTITIEEEPYRLSEDDILVINTGQIHEVLTSNNEIVKLQLDLSFFKDEISSDVAFACNSTTYHNKTKFAELKRCIANIVNTYYNEKENNELLLISLSYELLFLLIKNFKLTSQTNTSHSNKSYHRLGSIIKYLNTHYSEKITLEEVAEREFLCSSYLSHFFKMNMGVSFFHYLTNIRVNHAVNDLLNTSLSIEQIALNNGFSNSKYFVSAFKARYDMQPRQYRNKIKHESKVCSSQPMPQNRNAHLMFKQNDFLNKLADYLDTSNEKENSNPSKIISSDPIFIQSNQIERKLYHSFKVFTAVGRAKELLMNSIQQELRILQKEVGFHYIKFHGILDDTMMLYNETPEGQPYLTFQYVDQLIDFLLSINLRPLIQLSFMPKLLAKHNDETIFFNPVILSEPNDDSKWEYLITQLTLHLLNRYGTKEVEQWLFTFWNVPFKSCMFRFESAEIGCRLFKLTYNCVKKCNSGIKFGAPSFGYLCNNDKEYQDFLDFCTKNDCFPDFYNFTVYPVKTATSKHMATYGIITENDCTILSDDPDFVANSIDTMKQNLNTYPQLPIYITEWASTTSHRDWLNDTCYRSAYIVKNVLENYDKTNSLGNWCLSDTLEELPYVNELFHGELGIFAMHSIKKPAYYAFTFLNQLMDYLLAEGPGYFITTNQQDDYVILLYHYLHISPLYAQGVLFNVTFLDRYNAFIEATSRELDLVLKQVSNGTYYLTEHIVSRQYGSAFDEWVRMGAEPLCSELEIETLKGRSMPKLTKSCIEVQNQQINYFAALEPHEIRLIEIKKQHTL